MLLAEAANAVGLRFIGLGHLVSRLPFDPVELFKEPEGLLRRPATFLSGFEGVDEAPPGVGHASDMGWAMQCASGSVAIAHQYAAVVAEKGLRMDLAATGLIIEQYDWPLRYAHMYDVLVASLSFSLRTWTVVSSP